MRAARASRAVLLRHVTARAHSGQAPPKAPPGAGGTAGPRGVLDAAATEVQAAAPHDDDEGHRGIEQFLAAQAQLPPRDAGRKGSGVQQEVRSLYRELLREARRKEDPAAAARLHAYVRSQFRSGSTVPRRNFSQIEWMIRRGRDQLALLKETSPKDGFNVYVPG
eukprot:TRINITY_DN67502_c0_g1_i1.p1 TRINITY_DN67502_c0_g1~~TRINITY_DN67502_c0_g1_i1.p1  ORF type:complete len:192 (+),score=56.63 TRINITY_DN67502_c0_g1_i1:83-577(+)